MGLDEANVWLGCFADYGEGVMVGKHYVSRYAWSMRACDEQFRLAKAMQR